mmetsp:Transcript_173488/g.421966  ORF Transcript_173488/g.421966 Transcript_173488/m.421966 type:complete len:143 (+) Transcript_173488:75-503(+)
MATRASSTRSLGAILLTALFCLALRCLTPPVAGRQPANMFVAGASASPTLRGQAIRHRSPMVLFAASDGTMAKVADVIADQLGVEKDKVVRTATLTELGADSLDIVESVMALEEAFDVELPDDETTALKDVGDVADLIETKL